jgi:glutathione S-transferase
MASSILLYLDHYYPLDKSSSSHLTTANAYPTMLLAAGIMKAWLNRGVPGYADELGHLVSRLEEMVEANGGPFVAGARFSIADAFVWPVVHALVGEWKGWREGGEGEGGFPKLGEWYGACWRKKASVKKMAGTLAVPRGQKGEGGA